VWVAPPFSEQLQNVWFTDASDKREGKTWKYRATVLQIKTEQRTITEGEVVAVWSVFKQEAQSVSPICIYTDSFVVNKGCTGWLPFWEQNGWEVNRIPA